jgi:hypothetical protein
MPYAEAAVGERIRIITGLGMTETAPSCTFAVGTDVRSGHIGLPVPGVEVKLVPDNSDPLHGKTEIRFRGPNVMPGYWRAPEQTDEAFDEEGFYRTGDAVKFIDPAHPARGLLFDGRTAEDFKLSTGTFVSVGPLRAKVIAAGHPCVQDAVVTGLNRDEVGLLVFPRADECRKLAGLADNAPLPEVLHHPAVRAFFQALADRLFREGTGSANRPARLHVLAEPPSIDKGEVTDKARSISARAGAPRVTGRGAGRRRRRRPVRDPAQRGTERMNIQDKPRSSPAAAPALAEPSRVNWRAWARGGGAGRERRRRRARGRADRRLACRCDITDTASVTAALDAAEAAMASAHRDEHRRHRHRQARGAERWFTRTARRFRRVVRINLIGTCNDPPAAARIASWSHDRWERGVMVHRLGRGLRWPGGARGVLGVQGRPRGDDAAAGARPGAVRRACGDDRAWLVSHAADGRAAAGGAGSARDRRAWDTRQSSRRWRRTSSPMGT